MQTQGVRGIRGAVSVPRNTRPAILQETEKLLISLQEKNGFHPEELASVFFTMTPDLTETYPAEAARRLGWHRVPLLSGVEIDVPGMPPRIVRVLILWNTDRPQSEIVPVYLGEASKLRPDLAEGASGNP